MHYLRFKHLFGQCSQEKAHSSAEPIMVDIGQLLPNNKIAVTWQGMPIYIIRRTEKQIKALKYNDLF